MDDATARRRLGRLAPWARAGGLAALALALTAASACTQSAQERGAGGSGTDTGFRSCTIERVVDGDTVVCREGAERVRLLLIDTPEMEQEEYGGVAREALESIIPEGTAVRLELDVRERDQYGRLLAYLHTRDGRMVNEEMVRRGYALVLVYPPNVRYVERVREAAAEARAAGRGLWRGSAFECAPVDFRGGRCR